MKKIVGRIHKGKTKPSQKWKRKIPLFLRTNKKRRRAHRSKAGS